jgi:hypothetical protein
VKVPCETTLNTCELIHKKYHQKDQYHSDIKYHMTLNTICSVVLRPLLTFQATTFGLMRQLTLIIITRFGLKWNISLHSLSLSKTSSMSQLSASLCKIPACMEKKEILMKVSYEVRFLVRRLAQVYVAAAKWTRACIVWNILQINYLTCAVVMKI